MIYNKQLSSNDLHWTSEHSWDQQQQQQSSGLAILNNRSTYQGVTRSEDWEWQNQLLAQNMSFASHVQLDHEGEQKPVTGFMNQQQNQLLFGEGSSTAAAAAAGFQGSPLGMISNSSQASVQVNQQQSPASVLQIHSSSPSIPFASVAGPGDHLNNPSFHDFRSFEQRKRLYGLLDMDPRSRIFDALKRESLYAEANARIGLNLGVRTYFSSEDMSRLGKRPRSLNSPPAQVPPCQAEGCKADLSAAKHYHRRHKVCELHSKAATVTANGQTQRFCQQCSRFHPLGEFDEGKRSCRKRLADHNRRRRKPQPVNVCEEKADGDDQAEAEAEAEAEVEAVGTAAAAHEEAARAADRDQELKAPGTPTSSQDHSDNKTESAAESSGYSGHNNLRSTTTTTMTAALGAKSEMKSSAHSTLFVDRPVDTQALISTLSPSVSLIQKAITCAKDADLSLSSSTADHQVVQDSASAIHHPMSWFQKPGLEFMASSSASSMGVSYEENNRSCSSPSFQSSAASRLDWVFAAGSSSSSSSSTSSLQSSSRQASVDGGSHHPYVSGSYQLDHSPHQLFALLHNPLTTSGPA